MLPKNDLDDNILKQYNCYIYKINKMNPLKFIGIALLVLLAIFICYGIYYSVIAYFFVIKLLVFATIGTSLIWLWLNTKNKD